METVIHRQRVIIGNCHLANDARTRKDQIEELTRDIEHIQKSAKNVNIVYCGDFNQETVSLHHLKRVCDDEKTWRKNSERPWYKKLDFVFTSTHITSSVRWMTTNSDHKAANIVIDVETLKKFSRQTCPVTLSRLSKKRTAKSRPAEWKKYQNIKIDGYLGPNRLRWTLKTEVEMKEMKKKRRKKVFEDPLCTRE